jgi:CheY-like chemotaxis protein
MLTRTKPVDILLIEDNQGDIRLIREALAGSGVPVNLHITPDGDQAMSFLRNQAPFEAAARPDLILLDLNLPCRSGREVLTTIKSDRQLWSIPVVVLTASESDRDIREVYDLRTNSFITKPVHVDAYLATVKAIVDYWFRVVRLPQKG